MIRCAFPKRQNNHDRVELFEPAVILQQKKATRVTMVLWTCNSFFPYSARIA